MRRHTLILILATAFIWLAMVLLSHKVADDIASLLRDDAVAVLEVPVQVDQVNVSLASGRAQITGLQIGNPEGFPSRNIFDMSSVEVNISVLSLIPAAFGWSPYDIEEIRIDAPVVSVDVDENGVTNLDVVLRKIRQPDQKGAETGGAAPEQEDGSIAEVGTEESKRPGEHGGDSPTRIRVEQLAIENLSFRLNRAGRAERTGTIPPINMQDIGGEKGTTAAGLGVMVSSRLATDILAVVLANKAAEKLGGSVENLLKDLEKKLQN